jgi:hypothetical protein
MAGWSLQFLRGALLVSLAVLAGCSGSPVSAPGFSPGGAAGQAVAEFDTNGDGALDATELERCPGLQAAGPRADSDGDGKLTKAELTARFKSYSGDEMLVTTFPCRVLLDGQPLAAAQVTLVPEAFMGSAYQSATAATAEGGNTVLSAPEVQAKGFSGVYCGIYRIEISRRNSAGVETLPAKYNSQTTLGQEIAPDVQDLERGVTIELSSR